MRALVTMTDGETHRIESPTLDGLAFEVEELVNGCNFATTPQSVDLLDELSPTQLDVSYKITLTPNFNVLQSKTTKFGIRTYDEMKKDGRYGGPIPAYSIVDETGKRVQDFETLEDAVEAFREHVTRSGTVVASAAPTE